MYVFIKKLLKWAGVCGVDTMLEQTHLGLILSEQASYLRIHLSILNFNVFTYKMEIILPAF